MHLNVLEIALFTNIFFPIKLQPGKRQLIAEHYLIINVIEFRDLENF